MNKPLLCAAIAATFLFCANTNAQIVINEYGSSTSSFLDEYNEESDWIELYNKTASEVDLNGWHLTDNESNLAKWTFPSVKIPANGFLLVMASGKNLTEVAEGKYLHTNFNISSDGEAIFLVNAADSIVHQADSVPVPCNASRGLSPDGGDNWVFFVEPTPNKANTTKAYATSATTSVKFSPEGGCQKAALTVTLTAEGNAPIYYTLDCTEPTDTSLLYTGPITVDSTTVIRAITFNEDLMPGQPSTQSYIFPGRLHWLDRDMQGNLYDTVTGYALNDGIDYDMLMEHLQNGGSILDYCHDTTIVYDPHIAMEHPTQFTLPVVSLTTNPFNLWDSVSGIYVLGRNFEPTEPYYGANFHQDWERPVHVELYWTDGSKRLDQDAGLQIAGAWSRSNDQKSFSLHARNAYGKKYFEAKLFDELDIAQFKAFVLRDSGNDFGSTHFRDAMITHLIAGNNIDIQAYQPAIVYLNGEYWGILNMREKLNEHYVENHYPHVDHDKVDLLVGKGAGVTASEGDVDAYNAMMDFIKSHDLADGANYQKVAAQMEIDEYIEYLVTEIYGGNDDWPHNNVKLWKSKKNGGRWRWMLYDTDQSYDIWERDEDLPTYDKLEKCLSELGKNGDTWSNVLLRNLVKNTTFRNELSNRFADRMNREFLPENVNHLIDSLKGNISSEINFHNNRWYIGSYDEKVNRMKDFAKKRPSNMRKHLRKHFDVGDDVVVTLSENDSKAGYIQINSLTLKSFPWNGSYFKNVPVKLRAVARPGYKFVRWENADENDTISTNAGIELTLNCNATVNAVFEKDNESLYNSVVINEINYKSADDFDTKDWIELYNTTSAAINVSGWKISDEKPDEMFTIPAGTIIEPYGYLVVCANQNKLLKFNPEVINYVGDFEFGLGKDDKVQLFDSEGLLIDEVAYSKSWGDANGTGRTLALTDPFAENNQSKVWNDNDVHGTPGAQNGLFKPSRNDFSINEKVTINKKETPEEITGIEDAEIASVSVVCYPNPTNGQATLEWSQTGDANVRIELFNVYGNSLAQICNGWFAQGSHDIDISHITGNLAAGLYFAKISIDGQPLTNLKIMKQ
ncbi:MAG: CotH kinase family protein [Salinivirgaceae bacterium]|nr:CotH kinase family protein [Salinivirgaceae bacterium]